MPANTIPDQSDLKRLLDYNPQTGALSWKERQPDEFEYPKMCAVWNRRFAGRPALQARSGSGYCQGNVLGSYQRAHRVIWKLVTGDDPIEIDHINGDRADNRFANLRAVTREENCKNAGRSKRNKSGIPGVSFDRRSGRWASHASIDKRHTFLGSFGCKTAAHVARIARLGEVGFTQRHLGLGEGA